MFAILCLLLGVAGDPAPRIDTQFAQVHPTVRGAWKKNQPRAIVLIHGLHVQPLHSTRAGRARFHGWQEPGSSLVKALARDADVYAFAYGQNAPLEAIAAAPALRQAIERVKQLDYGEIVLVGHSAGGVIARLFVEDHPQAGVTRVIQICAPNAGTSWARADITVRKEQEPFLQSLTKAERQRLAEKRKEKCIPESCQFLCVVGTTTGSHGDGLLSRQSQWPEDLQRQCIPAVLLATTHFTVMRSSKLADRLAELARSPQPRWSEWQCDIMRKQILNGSPRLPG